MSEVRSTKSGGVDSGYHKLEVYQLAHDLGVRVHKMTMNLPKFEMYEEGSQIRRSSKSVSSNIVEGYVLRKYKNEFLHYLYRAHASSEETLDHLRYLHEVNSLPDKQLYNDLLESYRQLGSMLFRFIEAIEQQHDTPMFLKDIEEPYLPKPENLNLDESGRGPES